MGRIISITNQKGGVGKTTTTINLGACIAELNKKTGNSSLDRQIKVLLVDVDPQANTTGGMGFDKGDSQATIYEVMINDFPAEKAILKYEGIPGLEVLPSGIQLAGAAIELVNLEEREFRLKKSLEPLRSKYDFIFIDSPPSLGLMTLNTLAAADSVLIPVQCEYYALEGISHLLQTVNLVKGSFNPGLEIEGLLLTMHNSRTNLSFEVIDEVREYFKDKVFDTIIPRNVKLSEAPSYGKPVISYDPYSSGAEAYMRLAAEFIERSRKKYIEKAAQETRKSIIK